MILNDRYVQMLCEQQEAIRPYNPTLINPAGYNLTLSPDLIEIISGGVMTPDKHPGKVYVERKVKLQPGHEYLLNPGTFLLASSIEYVKLPNDIAAQVSLRSSTARMGIGHAYAGWIDPGFEGQITFELFSHIPQVLIPGKAICQIVFYQLIEPAIKPYQGKYQSQQGPTPAKPDLQLPLLGLDIPELEEDITGQAIRQVDPVWGIDTARSGGVELATNPADHIAKIADDARKFRSIQKDWSDET